MNRRRIETIVLVIFGAIIAVWILLLVLLFLGQAVSA